MRVVQAVLSAEAEVRGVLVTIPDKAMASKRIAQLGIVLFAAVLAPSIVIVVHGSQHPAYPHAIQSGETFPVAAAFGPEGQPVHIRASLGSHLVVIGAPSLALSAGQKEWIAQLTQRIAGSLECRTWVVTTAGYRGAAASEICPTADRLLIDEDLSLMRILGSTAGQARVCVIDDLGQVVLNAPVPDAAGDWAQQDGIAAPFLNLISAAAIATR